MNRFHSFVCMPALVVASFTAAAGCKKDASQAGHETGTNVVGCGSDYGDPAHLFCVKAPPGYEAKVETSGGPLYSETVEFNGPSSGFDIVVGFSSSNFTSFAQQLASDEGIMKSTDRKIDSTGSTPGQGKWWVYSSGSSKSVAATAKSNGEQAILCSPNNTEVAPEVIDACKSIRAYPGGAVPSAPAPQAANDTADEPPPPPAAPQAATTAKRTNLGKGASPAKRK